LFCHLLEALVARDTLRPGAQQRINVSLRHDFLLKAVQLFGQIVIINRFQKRDCGVAAGLGILDVLEELVA